MKKIIALSKSLPKTALGSQAKVESNLLTISNGVDSLTHKVSGVSDGVYHKELIDKGIFELTKSEFNFERSLQNDDYRQIGEIMLSDLPKLKTALGFVSKDDLRPAMQGIFMGKDIVSTDAHKLFFKKSESKIEKDIILKASCVKMLLNAESTIQVFMTSDDRFVKFVCDQFEYRTNLIDGNFPNYKAVIPSDNTEVKVNQKELLDALKLLSNYWNKHTKKIVLNFNSEGILTLTAEDIDFELHKEISISFEGYTNIGSIGLNGKFLELCVKTSKNKSTTIDLSTPNIAIIVNKNALLMPVMI